MEIQHRKIDGIAILDLEGDLVLPTGSEALSRAVQELVKAGETRLLINVEKVDRVDSVGIEELVRSYTRVTDSGGHLRLVKVGARMLKLLNMANLSTILQICDDEEQALNSFPGS